MIAGGQDGWPVHVGSYGLLGALYPDQEALVEGLWTGEQRGTTSRASNCSTGTPPTPPCSTPNPPVSPATRRPSA